MEPQRPAHSFQGPLRDAGIHVTYDLKKPDHGINGTYRDALIIDGWLYSPGIPARLHNIERPGPQAHSDEHTRFARLIAERMRWAFPAHASPEPHRVRVASPVTRQRIRCAKLPKVGQSTDPSAPTCRKPHPPGEACGINTLYYPATAAPRTWQHPPWGTPEWVAIYNRRSAVERYFGHLKSDAGTGFRRGRFQIRGLAKVALITGLSVAATNIKLRRARPD